MANRHQPGKKAISRPLATAQSRLPRSHRHDSLATPYSRPPLTTSLDSGSRLASVRADSDSDGDRSVGRVRWTAGTGSPIQRSPLSSRPSSDDGLDLQRSEVRSSLTPRVSMPITPTLLPVMSVAMVSAPVAVMVGVCDANDRLEISVSQRDLDEPLSLLTEAFASTYQKTFGFTPTVLRWLAPNGRDSVEPETSLRSILGSVPSLVPSLKNTLLVVLGTPNETVSLPQRITTIVELSVAAAQLTLATADATHTVADGSIANAMRARLRRSRAWLASSTVTPPLSKVL